MFPYMIGHPCCCCFSCWFKFLDDMPSTYHSFSLSQPVVLLKYPWSIFFPGTNNDLCEFSLIYWHEICIQLKYYSWCLIWLWNSPEKASNNLGNTQILNNTALIEHFSYFLHSDKSSRQSFSPVLEQSIVKNR